MDEKPFRLLTPRGPLKIDLPFQSLRSWLLLEIVALTLFLANPKAKAQEDAGRFRYVATVDATGIPPETDFKFRLYDAATGGTQIGRELTFLNVFRLGLTQLPFDLDFGVTAFGGRRWLEIATRLGGRGGYTTQRFRQELLSAPKAIHAEIAERLSGPIPLDNLPSPIPLEKLPTTIALLNEQGIFTGSPIFAPSSAVNPPFAVSSAVKVPFLNVDLLDGMDSSRFWNVGGNAGTTPTLNFLGTTDGKPLRIQAAAVGININNPSETLDVVGNIKADKFIGDGSLLTGVGGSTGLQGPPGPQGPAGMPGPVGPQGPVGPAGSGDAWSRTGDAATTVDNFLGTTDKKPFTIKVDGQAALRLMPATAGPNVLGGAANNSIAEGASSSVIAGGGRAFGAANSIAANSGFIGGGDGNAIQSAAGNAVIAGGGNNTVNANFGAIGGGQYNGIEAGASVGSIAGGNLNVIKAGSAYGFIGGGLANQIETSVGIIGGGEHNRILHPGAYAAIGGGYYNTNAGSYSFVGGGTFNNIQFSAAKATIAGGNGNAISASYASVGGGFGNTVSGQDGTISGGSGNIVTAGQGAVAGGILNAMNASEGSIGGGSHNIVATAATGATIPGGRFAQARSYGQMAYASGAFSSPGDAQTATYVLRGNTTDATPTEIFLDGVSQRMKIPTHGVWVFDILIVGNGSLSGGFQIKGIVQREANVDLLGVPIKTTLHNPTSGQVLDAFVEADTANGSLSLKVKGVPGTFIQWVASVRTVESSY